MTPRYYTGIGSRATPPEVLLEIGRISAELSTRGYTLRTGGTTGADSAFLSNSDDYELFLPWPMFNSHRSLPDPFGVEIFTDPTGQAFAIAAKHHPAWSSLSPAVRKLMARDVHQVLGYDCQTPSRFVVCWTPDGAEVETTAKTGGTGMAIQVAAAQVPAVPVVNVARAGWRARVEGML